jgi:hypothetical protein
MTLRILVLAALVAAGGCGASSSGGAGSASSTTSGSSLSASPPAPTATVHKKHAPSSGLTGYGATNSAWEAHHKADTASGFTKGSAYDPNPALVRGGDPRFQDKYYAVEHDGGRVDQYQMRFPPGTTVDKAKREVLASEFPSDARGKVRTLNSCAIMNVKSAKLHKAIGMNAAVEFVSGAAGDTYDPNDVWGAIVSFGPFSEC